MFKLRSAATVGGHRSPVVVPDDAVDSPKSEHGFDRETHAYFHLAGQSRMVIMRDLQIRVELGAYAMANEVLHNTQTKPVGMGVNGFPDGIKRSAGAHRVDGVVHAGSGFTNEHGVDVVDVAHQEGAAGITVYAVEEDGDVDIDDVAVAQLATVGDAMANDLVDRGADRLGEAAIVQWAGIPVTGKGLLVDPGIDCVGGDARRDHRASDHQHFSGGGASTVHSCNLVW